MYLIDFFTRKVDASYIASFCHTKTKISGKHMASTLSIMSITHSCCSLSVFSTLCDFVASHFTVTDEN